MHRSKPPSSGKGNSAIVHAPIVRREFLRRGAVLMLAAAVPCAIAKSRSRARFDWKLHRPQEVGMSAGGLEGIRAAVQKHIDNHNLPGAVTVVARHNKVVWYEAQGLSDVQSNGPLRKDDIFRIMSGSKPITAVALLMMMEAGKLSIDDKVSRFIPSFKDPKVAVAPNGWQRAAMDPSKRSEIASQIKLVPAEREITIRDLLTHTAGFSTMGPGMLASQIPHLPDDTLASYADRVGAMPLDFQPGSRFSYSPADGFDVLLRIVEIASGRPADVFVQDRILKPLDMKDTYFNVPSEKASRIVKLYDRKDGGWRPAQSVFGNGPMKYISGAGGLLSTAHDFIQYQEMLLNEGELNGKRVLKPETVKLLATNHVGLLYANANPGFPALTAGQGFGLGVAVTLDSKAANTGRGRGAFGWPGAYGVDSWADPELDLTAAFFVQQTGIAATHVADQDFQQAVRAAIVA
jgi:CubicO group peptidase (beta-lactamase class C family)